MPFSEGKGEVAHAILWLASEESSYSSGSILDVAGGR
jgi:NAD(P)-dependent dehydrogenase (short-subunit alcohol dehydrogenase family)